MQDSLTHRASCIRRQATARGAALLACILAACAASGEDVILDVSHAPVSEPSWRLYEFPLDVPQRDSTLGVVVRPWIRRGEATFTVTSPQGAPAFEARLGPNSSVATHLLRSGPFPGTYLLAARQYGLVGSWHAAVFKMPDQQGQLGLLVAGPFTLLVGLTFLVGWRLHARAPWRCFAAGAAMWCLWMALRVLWSMSGGRLLESHISQAASLAAAPFLTSAHAGGCAALTALAAVGLWAWLQPSLRRDSGRAVATGIGMGTAYAAFSAISTALSAVSMVNGGEDCRTISLAYAAARTPLYWLVGAGQSVGAMLIAIALCSLVVRAAPAKKWLLGPLWAFTLVAGFEGLSAAPDLFPAFEGLALWWPQACAWPLALAAFYAARWCVRAWPALACGDRPAELHPANASLSERVWMAPKRG